MTSANQDGYIVSASSVWSNAFADYQAFNNKPFEGQTTGAYSGTNGWSAVDNSFNSSGDAILSRPKFGFTIPQEWIQVILPSAKTIISIKLKFRGDSSYTFAPRDFKFYISNDGETTWRLLESVENYSVNTEYQETEYSVNGHGTHIGMSITGSNLGRTIVVGELFIKGY